MIIEIDVPTNPSIICTHARDGGFDVTTRRRACHDGGLSQDHCSIVGCGGMSGCIAPVGIHVLDIEAWKEIGFPSEWKGTNHSGKA